MVADGGRITMSRASLAPEITGPPTHTGSPLVSALAEVFLPCSRTTVLPTRCQVSVMPVTVRTTMALPLTDVDHAALEGQRAQGALPGAEGELPDDAAQQARTGTGGAAAAGRGSAR